jgi:REP element-mobilizing transposase RayT
MSAKTPSSPIAPPRGHAALRRGRASLPGQIYNVTVATLDRTPFFTTFRVAAAAARCFGDRAVLQDADMLAWVLMPDHAHWLVQLGERTVLPALLNRLKSASARHANRQLGRTGSLWAPAYHDRALRREDDIVAVARYIVANPVRAGLVRSVREYSFWDAKWLT